MRSVGRAHARRPRRRTSPRIASPDRSPVAGTGWPRKPSIVCGRPARSSPRGRASAPLVRGAAAISSSIIASHASTVRQCASLMSPVCVAFISSDCYRSDGALPTMRRFRASRRSRPSALMPVMTKPAAASHARTPMHDLAEGLFVLQGVAHLLSVDPQAHSLLLSYCRWWSSAC